MLAYHSAIKIMFTQIVLIAAVKRILYNTIKNNVGIIVSLKAGFSWGRCGTLALQDQWLGSGSHCTW